MVVSAKRGLEVPTPDGAAGGRGSALASLLPTACCFGRPSFLPCREKEKAARGEERAKEREEREKQASTHLLLLPA